MRLAVVTEALPNPGTVGSDVFSWGVLTHLRGLGHDVLCCAIVPTPKDSNRADFSAKVAALEALGLKLRVFHFPAVPPAPNTLSSRLRELVHPDLSLNFPTIGLSGDLRRELEDFRADSVFVFDTGPVLALADARSLRRVAIPGDPAHLARAFQRKVGPRPGVFSPRRFTNAISAIAFAKRYTDALFKALRQYERVGYLGAQHARWIREQGIACDYVKMCVADRAGSSWEELRTAHRYKGKLKLLFLGHLGGTASRAGLDEFVDVTVPILERELGAGAFELHIVGRGLPAALAERFRRPGVILRGFVEDAGPEYLSADVFLSPTPYPVGIRTRIVEAFSWGVPVVTHPDSGLGLPELTDGKNLLFGRNGEEWAEAVIRLAKDEALRIRLSRAARSTYEENFIPAVSAGQIFRMLEDAATGKRPVG